LLPITTSQSTATPAVPDSFIEIQRQMLEMQAKLLQIHREQAAGQV
jgi:hypothetical protein